MAFIGYQPPDFSASTPSAIAPQPPQQSDYQNDYRTMLAPYQQNAQRIFGGDPIFGNSRFVTDHPTASHVLSNLLLAASKSQPGMTIGDSIRNVAGMAIAPFEARREQQYNLATAPGKLAAPELQLMQHLSQMRYQNSEITRNQAYADYLSGAKTDQAQAAADARTRPQHVGNPQADDEGHLWQPTWDPVGGKAGHIPLEPVPQGYTPTFNKLHKSNIAGMNTDYQPAGILRRLNDPDPKVREQAQQDQENYIHMQSGIAGGKTGAEQNAPHPQTNTADLIRQEHSNAFNDIPKPPAQPPKEFVDTLPLQTQIDVLQGKTSAQSEYEKRIVNPWQSKYNERRKKLDQWENSGAPRRGERFDPSKDYSKDSTLAPAVNSGANWQPKP